jgi:DNA invertase Pin-like site-specific DNA recombinase
MNNAIIYARYSSTGQNEQSIEAQVKICNEFARQRDLNVVKIYIDKAKSGTNDNRPDFQKMIGAAASGTFQYVIVYMFDRFARNRRDSIMYKEMLKEKYGVKVVSALEPITDDEGGEFYEMFLEWNAEKYSQRLSKRIKDGLATAIDNGTYTGSRLAFGYKLVDTDKVGKKGVIHKVAIDEEQAEIVRFVFGEYAKGTDKKEIAEMLNAQGLRRKGDRFNIRTFEKWLFNPKYTGEYMLGGRLVNNIYPQIIDKPLFDKVQERLGLNKRLAGTKSALEPYFLTGKAFCGHCGTAMVSDGGTGKLGKKHYYYACKQMKKRLCNKKRENKDALEKFVVEEIIKFLSQPKWVNRIADDMVAHYEKRTGEDGLRSIQVKITNAHKQVAEWTVAFVEAKSALLRNNIERQIAEYEILINDLEVQKTKLELERGVKLSKKDIVSFVAEMMNFDPSDKEHWRTMVDILVKKLFIYDNRYVCFFNLMDGEIESITFEDANTAIQKAEGVQTLTPILHQRSIIRTFTIFRGGFAVTFKLEKWSMMQEEKTVTLFQ